MDWNAIKIFIAIANKGTLIGAAESLSLSHSTVYRRLNDLEKKVGRLFERLNGSYELTQMGQEMLVSAQNITHSFEDIERHIAGKDKQPKGLVRITAPSSFAYNYLPKRLNDLSKRYPEIQVELLVTNFELNMTNRRADIAIRVTSTPPEHLVGREISRIKWGVYAKTGYTSKYGKPRSLEGLANHRLIGAAGALRSHPAFIWLDKKHTLNIGPRTDDLVAMSFLASSDQGLALLPDDLMRPGLERLFTFDHTTENQLWVLTHPDLRKVERVKIVMKFLASSLSNYA